MKRTKINKLLKVLEKEYEKAKVDMEKTKSDADEIARSAYNSPSQSGDRYHEEKHAEITQQRFYQVEALLNEIKAASKESVPVNVVMPSYVKIKYESGGTDEFFIVENLAYVKDVKLVSSKSPLPKALLRKKVGHGFDINNKNGLIVEVG